MEPLNEFFSWNLRHINAEGERLMTEDELLELFERMEADDLPETAMSMGEADGYEGWAFLRIAPLVVSMLDYTQGFGHTELADLRT